MEQGQSWPAGTISPARRSLPPPRSIRPAFNGAFTGLKTDEGGALMYATRFGLVRFDVAAMQAVASPEAAGAAECGG